MSLSNALKLIKTIDFDESLRDGMYKCINAESLKDYLFSQGMDCSYAELDEAINSLHVQCQTLEEAQNLLHKADMIRFIFQTT